MKLINLLMVLTAFTLFGCEKDDTKSSPSEQVIQSAERRGGNGNGNGNGQGNNNQVTDPCANYPMYPVVNQGPIDFNIKVDTTLCGMVVFRWDAQPGFNPVLDTCYTIARYYYISFANIGHTNGCSPNGGSISQTNAYYYTLGAGCSLWPGYKYSVAISYYERNQELQKTFLRYSNTVEFTAGTRAPWLNNCN